MLGLHCCSGFSLVVASMGYSLATMRGLLTAVASLAEHELQAQRLQALQHRDSFSTACGIFSDRGLHPCLLPWQADSLLLSHQGSPLDFDLLVYNYLSSQRINKQLQMHYLKIKMTINLPG